MQSVNTLLFDLDGTLVDSAPDIADAMDKVLGDLGIPAAGEELARDWVGNGVRKLMERALAHGLPGAADDALLERAVTLFMDEYGDRMSVRSRLFPGVREGLDRFLADGYRLGCVTNKPEALSIRLMRELGLGEDQFPVVVGGDTTARKKPDPLPLRHAMNALGSTPAETLLVGDSVNDVKAARGAGIDVVCVSYGYNHGSDIREAGADRVVDDFIELHRLLREAA